MISGGIIQTLRIRIQGAIIERGRLMATSALSLNARCAAMVIASKLSRTVESKSLQPTSGYGIDDVFTTGQNIVVFHDFILVQ